MHGRERKAVPGPTETDIRESLKEYKTNEDVRTELLSPKGYVVKFCIPFALFCNAVKRCIRMGVV